MSTPNDLGIKLSNALWCDLRTNEQKRDWLLMGRGFSTGIICGSLQNEFASTFNTAIEQKKLISELEKENNELEDCFDECHTELGKVQRELEKEVRSKDKRITELEKERDIRDLEQQAKGIEDFSERYCRNSIELEHEAVLACAFQYAEQLSKQAKAIEEKQNEN